MPYIGLSSFLQELCKEYDCKVEVCQCPVSGFLHFYANFIGENMSSLDVSMPCIELSSFLHQMYKTTCSYKELCQCPVSSFLHFYDKMEDVVPSEPDDVSMPCIELSSFLP